MMNMETLVNVESVCRDYGGFRAVDDISFSVHRGEVLGFLGPNGAGKSTTMRIICGVLAATHGSVSIAGHDIVDEPLPAKRHLGFLPEQPPLYRDSSVDDYLYYCAGLRRTPGAKLKNATENAKQRCGLESVGHRLIGNLSKGFQQRVGIAQAIIHSPAVIVLDEPTAGLDPNQIIEIRQLVRELSEDHSVILSTHILPEVQTTCDRVLIINNGRLVLDEALSTLHQNDKTQCLSLALHRPPLLEELEQIEGVSEVTPLDRYRFRIVYQSSIDIPAVLAEIAVSRDWGLFEMIPQGDSLEQTFVQLTRGDVMIHPEAASPV
ncbi:MAG: ATP-binding cassette domain-containing protein [Gammaproteobacteria bacterium]